MTRPGWLSWYEDRWWFICVKQVLRGVTYLDQRLCCETRLATPIHATEQFTLHSMMLWFISKYHAALRANRQIGIVARIRALTCHQIWLFGMIKGIIIHAITW